MFFNLFYQTKYFVVFDLIVIMPQSIIELTNGDVVVLGLSTTTKVRPKTYGPYSTSALSPSITREGNKIYIYVWYIHACKSILIEEASAIRAPFPQGRIQSLPAQGVLTVGRAKRADFFSTPGVFYHPLELSGGAKTHLAPPPWTPL